MLLVGNCACSPRGHAQYINPRMPPPFMRVINYVCSDNAQLYGKMCLPISQGPNKKWLTPGVYLKSYQELGILTWEETSTFCISSKIKLKWEKLIPMLLGKYKLIQIELTFWIQALDSCMVWKYGHVFIPSFCSDLKGSAYCLMELQRTERLGRIFKSSSSRMPPFYWQHTPNLLNYGVQKKLLNYVLPLARCSNTFSLHCMSHWKKKHQALKAPLSASNVICKKLPHPN